MILSVFWIPLLSLLSMIDSGVAMVGEDRRCRVATGKKKHQPEF